MDSVRSLILISIFGFARLLDWMTEDSETEANRDSLGELSR